MAATPTLLTALTVTGVLATGAFAVQIWAQRLLPAPQVALIYSAEPAWAAWLAWYVLGERLSAKGWWGSALILIALAVGSLPLGRKKTPAPSTESIRME